MNASLPWLAAVCLLLLASVAVYLLEPHLPMQAVRARAVEPVGTARGKASTEL